MEEERRMWKLLLTTALTSSYRSKGIYSWSPGLLTYCSLGGLAGKFAFLLLLPTSVNPFLALFPFSCFDFAIECAWVKRLLCHVFRQEHEQSICILAKLCGVQTLGYAKVLEIQRAAAHQGGLHSSAAVVKAAEHRPLLASLSESNYFINFRTLVRNWY